MAKQIRITSNIHTPQNSPNETLVKRGGDPAADCPSGTICIRASIVEQGTGTKPDEAMAEVYHSDPGQPQDPGFPASPPGGAHSGEIGDYAGYNSRWDQDGGSPVDGVWCDEEPQRDENWVVVWARWGTGADWQYKDVVHVLGKCAKKTECE